MAFKKYSLTDSQLTQITRLCVQEQGNLDGIRAEASLMANLLETSTTRMAKYGTGGTGLYNFVRNGGWFYKASYFMDNGHCTAAQKKAVKEVLVSGKRTLPQYVDEHDCLTDIKSISTGDVYDRSDYKQNITVIRNRMGSTYTFYCFPAPGCDPFGYTEAAYNWVKKTGGAVPAQTDNRKTVTTTLPEIGRGDEGDAVAVWQIIAGVNVDGDFGPATQAATIKFQMAHGLKGDGIVGVMTWAEGLKSVN